MLGFDLYCSLRHTIATATQNNCIIHSHMLVTYVCTGPVLQFVLQF